MAVCKCFKHMTKCRKSEVLGLKASKPHKLNFEDIWILSNEKCNLNLKCEGWIFVDALSFKKLGMTLYGYKRLRHITKSA